MANIRLSWTRTDLVHWLQTPGTRSSHKHGNDSDAEWSDPRARYGLREPASWPRGGTGYLVRPLHVLVVAILTLAKEVKNGDIVFIFGRDCWPVQPLLASIGHKLRGTWVYVEGASREVAWDVVLRYQGARPDGQVFGVDTGFSGTVPHRAIKVPYTLRMLSAVYDHYQIMPGRWRTTVLALEHMPKPFLRAVEVDDKGRPVMRLACKADLEASLRIWDAVASFSSFVLPELGKWFRGEEVSLLAINPDMEEA